MGKIGMRHTLVSTIKPQGEVANLIPQKRERGEEGVCSVIAGRLTLLRNDKVDDSTFRFSARRKPQKIQSVSDVFLRRGGATERVRRHIL